MEIYFIRHTSVDVEPGVCYGFTDVPLKESFPQEAQKVKDKLDGITFDAVFSSPLTRARKLAEYCGYPSPIVDTRIKEVNYGDWEMVKFTENKDPRLEEWYNNWQTYKIPGGESYEEFYFRVVDFIEELKKSSYQKVAAFCHGGVLTSVALYKGIISLDNPRHLLFDYGDVLKIEV